MSVRRIIQRHGTKVSTYEKTNQPKDAYGQQQILWVLLDTDVPFHLQLGPGRLSQEPVGEMAEGRYPAFGNSGIGLVQGNGVQITTANDATEIGRRFVVERCKDWGRRGGWQGEVSETIENFTASAS